MKNKHLFLSVIIFLSLVVLPICSEVKLPCFINNGMVLQRDIKVPVWGWASVGEKIQIEFNGATYNTVTGEDRKWKLKLNPSKAGGPYQMIVKGSNTIVLKDILMGDVWFCSGQSNMEFEMKKVADKYAKEIESSENNKIRQIVISRKPLFNATPDVETYSGWQSANSQTVLKFTAVGYFYAKELFEKYKIPIGLINCCFPGTPAEAWINETTLKKFPAYFDRAMELKDTAKVNNIRKKDKLYTDNWYSQVKNNDLGIQEKWFSTSNNYSDWGSINMPDFWQNTSLKEMKAGVVWLMKEIEIPESLAGKNAILYLGNIVMIDSTYFNGNKVGYVDNRYNPRRYKIDGKLLKAGKNTIVVRVLSERTEGGFIKNKSYKLDIEGRSIDLTGDWHCKIGVNVEPFQREKLTSFQRQPSSMYYGMLSPLIGYGIKGVVWYQGEDNSARAKEYQSLFPALINSWRDEWKQGDFPFLYVQLANFNPAVNKPGESKWAELQEAQSMTLALPNTGMAVINDLGEWNDIHPSNKYDVGKRLALVAQKVVYHDKKVISSGPTFKTMKREGKKIIITFTNIGSGLIAKGGGELKYFTLAGSDKKFVWAKAKIEKNKVVVWNDEISSPMVVRYAWADNPQGANLYNKEGLPASCFRTDK
jgi:sialate O-acetylesterase